MADMWASSGTTDMFTRPAAGSVTGSGPDDAPPEPPQRPEPAAAGAGAGDSGSGSRSMFSAPVTSEAKNGSRASGTNGTNGASGSGGTNGFSWDSGASGSSADGVVVPPAEHATEYRLPIFEAVESDWFRRGRNSVGWAPGEGDGDGDGAGQSARPAWSSPADEGWQAAAAVSTPSSSGTTTAGLPKRVPRANLVPGAVGSDEPAPAPTRSASVTRDRFASFQRGIREGRAAASSGESQAGEDDGSR